MTNEELMSMDPSDLNAEDFNRWKSAQKRFHEISRTTKQTLQDQVEYEEMKTRLYVAQSTLKTSLAQMMEATIKISELHSDYYEAEAKNKQNSLERQEKTSES